MKRLLFFSLVLTLILSCFSFGQVLKNPLSDTCYLPLAVGNKWQYYEKYTHFSTFSSVVSHGLTELKITKDTLINNIQYFYFDKNWLRYDNVTQSIYIPNSNGGEDLLFDFRAPLGVYSSYMSTIGKILTILGHTEYCKGYSKTDMTNTYSSNHYFMNNIGKVYFENFSNGPMDLDFSSENTLIGFHSNDTTISDIAKPSFDSVYTTVLQSKYLAVFAQIKHKYSSIKPNIPNYPSSFYRTSNYTDSAYVDYFYTNGTDTIRGDKVNLTARTEINFGGYFLLNFDLLVQGYNLFYKVVACDKAYIPHTVSYPENSYLKVEFALNPNINYYPLNTGNKWVYEVDGIITKNNTKLSSFYLYVYVQKDTILSNGLKYFKIAYNNNIKYERVDSSKGFTYRAIIDDNNSVTDELMDVLSAQKDQIFNGRRHCETDTFKCIDISQYSLFNIQNVQTKRFKVIYDYMGDYTLAYNIGMVYDNYSEGINLFSSHLVAAYVNGIYYGDPALLVDVNENNSETVPTEFSLKQNYPNPFNPSTTIEFNVPQIGDVKLTVYDILGKEINTLINKNLNAGNYSVNFDGTGLSSGIYFYTLKFEGKQTITKKMVLTK